MNYLASLPWSLRFLYIQTFGILDPISGSDNLHVTFGLRILILLSVTDWLLSAHSTS